MNAIPFDTLKRARGSEAASMSPAMANGSAEALPLAIKDADCATKAGVAAVKADVALVKADVALVRTELKGHIAAVHASVERLRHDMTIKLGGMIFLAAGLMIAAMRLIPPPH